MFIYAKQIIMLICAVSAASCVSTDTVIMPETGTAPDVKCMEGMECTIEGNLFVYRGSPASVAEIKTASSCFAIALEDSDYQIYHKKNGSTVQLRGVAYSQSSAENVVSYRLIDRDVATGICSSGLIIYAEKVEFLKVR